MLINTERIDFLLCERGGVRIAWLGGDALLPPPPGGQVPASLGALAGAPAALARLLPVLALVERFDIEPFPDFSAK